MPVFAKTFSQLLPNKDQNVVMLDQQGEQTSKNSKRKSQGKKRNKEQSNDDEEISPTTKKKKDESPDLQNFVTECKNWTREQVKSILLKEYENNKIRLTREEIEQLYNNGFDGQFIQSVINEERINTKNMTGGVVVVITSWIVEKREKFEREKRKKEKRKKEKREKEKREKFEREKALKERIESLEVKNDISEGTELYASVRMALQIENPDKKLSESGIANFKQLLYNKTTIPESDILLGTPNFGEEFKSTELPIRSGKLAKERLPYFSQFHYKMAKDDEIFEHVNKEEKGALMFMGPSGCGKTATAVRLFCKTPGMLLTCTHSAESSTGLTTDSLMKQMYSYLQQLELFELYGCVQQTILLTFICRLIYILKLIENAKENPKVIEPFQGILPYLAFMQSNGKTVSSEYAFSSAMNYNCTEPSLLSRFINELVGEIILKLDENSKMFGIEKKIKKFIVVIDEANVYASNSSTKIDSLIGLNGKKRGLLSCIARTITDIHSFHVSLFMGTNFSVNVGEIIQSACAKSEAKIVVTKYYDFGLVASEDLIKFLQQHINIPKKELEYFTKYLNSNNFKYFRRRLITFALELLTTLDENIKKRKLVSAFEQAIELYSKDICTSMVRKYFIEYMNQSKHGKELGDHLQMGIRYALVNYISHYEFPFLKDDFKVDKNGVADALLYSGFCGPKCETNSVFTFSAIDFLGYETAKLLLDMIINGRDKCKQKLSEEENEKVMKFVISSKIEFIMNTSDNNVDMEYIILLRLAMFNGERMENIQIFSSLIEKHPKFKKHKFKSTSFLNSKQYLTYCSKKEIDVSPFKDGEHLYWSNFAEKKWPLLDGVFITLSNSNHSEFFGVNLVDDKVITISLQCKIRSGTSVRVDADQFFASTMHQLFYLDNYAKIQKPLLKEIQTGDVLIIQNNTFKLKRKATGNEVMLERPLKINTTAQWYANIRQKVQSVFEECTPFHLIVQLHPTLRFGDVEDFKQIGICSFIDMRNVVSLLGESAKNLKNYLDKCNNRTTMNNKV